MPIFGAKSRAMRGCASKPVCGRRIGPAVQAVFTVIYSEFATSQWADASIGPYRKWLYHVAQITCPFFNCSWSLSAMSAINSEFVGLPFVFDTV